MYHFTNHHHQYYHQAAYQQHCPVLDNTKQSVVLAVNQNQLERIENQHNVFDIQPEVIEEPTQTQVVTQNCDKKQTVVNKSTVDTSNYSIEERLVAAVWVHERKATKISMSQIKQDFRNRFARESPAKNTLLVWERKLFSTGSVHDAPRTGRPINRCRHTAAVAASLCAAPTQSLRSRARTLRLPRSTLRTILHNDLRHSSGNQRKTSNKRRKKPVSEVVPICGETE